MMMISSMRRRSYNPEEEDKEDQKLQAYKQELKRG